MYSLSLIHLLVFPILALSFAAREQKIVGDFVLVSIHYVLRIRFEIWNFRETSTMNMVTGCAFCFFNNKEKKQAPWNKSS